MITLTQLVTARFDRAVTLVRIEQHPGAVWRVRLKRRHIGWILRYHHEFIVTTAATASRLTWTMWRSAPNNRLWAEPRDCAFDARAVLAALIELDGNIDLP